MTPSRPPVPPGPYLVAGIGRAGMAAVRALERHDPGGEIRAWDAATHELVREHRDELRARGIRVWLGDDGAAALDADPRPACVVKSPGLRFDVPVIARAVERGIPVIDELELGWRLGAAPLIAVTGTNGKSTTAALCRGALGAAGIACGEPVGNTVFGPPLCDAERGPWTVCEVSSYQLEGSPAFLPEVAVLTNLTHEHLDRHGTMRRYGQVKRRLFVRGDRAVPLAVVNVEQTFGRVLAREVEERGGRVVRFGTRPEADFALESCSWTLDSGSARIRTPSGLVELETRLPGPHNARNATAALALAWALGLDPGTVVRGLEATPVVPGRFELVDEGQPFDVVIDFAHSPDGLLHALRTVREVVRSRPGAMLRAVVTSKGADPDTDKRYEMGRVARELADQLIITTGWRLGEWPSAIAVELGRGARSVPGGPVEMILERREAIGRAIRAARPGDVVVVTCSLLFRLYNEQLDAGRPHDDREVAREALRELSLARSGGPRRAVASEAGSRGIASSP